MLSTIVTIATLISTYCTAFRMNSRYLVNIAKHDCTSTRTPLSMANEGVDLRNVAIIAHVGM